ncbi:hypothetical protein ACFLYO_10755, partial [Chloroflexota bacterium]
CRGRVTLHDTKNADDDYPTTNRRPAGRRYEGTMMTNTPTQPPSMTTTERVMLLAILLAYGLLAGLYATQTPAWQVPDEPAHYNYTRQVAEAGCCPVLEAADWDAAYLVQLTSSGFDPLADLGTVQYEDHQPPLFYLLAAPIFNATDGSLLAVRLFSVLLGAGVVLCTYGIARAVTGGHAIIALSAAAFTAFLPQHLANLAGAGNDSLAELIVGVGVLLAAWTVTPTVTRPVPLFGGAQADRSVPVGALLVLGLVMGLGFISKATTFVLGPVIVLAILLRWLRTADRRWRDLFLSAALFLIPALLIGGLWWGRNVGVYGWPDVMGLGRHDAVVVGQPRTADWIAEQGFVPYVTNGIAITFRSTWGQFGWMGVPLPGWVYRVLLVFTGISWLGLIPLAIRVRRTGGLTIEQRDGVLIMATLLLMGGLAFLYYNTAFVQFQGRYLFPALSAVALAHAAGWTGWAGLAEDWLNVAGQLAQPLLRWLPVVVMWGLAALAALALWRWIVPNLPGW